MKKITLLKTVLTLCLMLVGMGAWAEEVVYYTNSCPKSTTNTAYATYYDVTVAGIDWTAPGNQYADGDWRLGGKGTTSDNKYLYTKTAIDKDITKIVVTHGTKTAGTVGDITLNVYSTAALAAEGGTGDISSMSTAYVDNGSITFIRPAGHDWNNRFYRFTYPINPDNTKSNKMVPVKSFEFYHDNTAGSTPSGPAVESHKIALNVAAGTYNVAQNVKVTNYEKSYIYAYTTDGTTPALDEMLDPTGTSSVYDNANGINITTACTLKVIAYDDEMNTSNVVSADYIIKPDAPTYSVDDTPIATSTKSFRTSAEVSIAAAAGCNIYYTTDGSTPTSSSTAYTDAFTVTETTTLKAIAVDAYNNVSSYKTLTLTIIEGTLFAFDDADALTAWGIKLPSASAGTDLTNTYNFVADGITVQVKKGGSTNTRIWNSSGTYDLRLYGTSTSKGSIVVTAPTGYNVTSVIFEGSTVSMSNLTNKAWSGMQSSITFEASSNQKISNVTIKVEAIPAATISIASACTDGKKCYSTYSNTSAWVVPENLTVSEVAVVDGELLVEDYSTGAIVPANTGVLVSASEGGDYTVTLSNEAGSSVLGTDNCLHPSSEEMTGNNLFYRLTMHKGTQIGFWWGAEEGAAFSLAANKAYLAVPKSAGVKASCWFGEDSEDAIGSPISQSLPRGEEEIFNLAGQRLQKMQKGINIVNGKKVIK